MHQGKYCWGIQAFMLSAVVGDKNMGDCFLHKLLNIFKFSMSISYYDIHN